MQLIFWTSGSLLNGRFHFTRLLLRVWQFNLSLLLIDWTGAYLTVVLIYLWEVISFSSDVEQTHFSYEVVLCCFVPCENWWSYALSWGLWRIMTCGWANEDMFCIKLAFTLIPVLEKQFRDRHGVNSIDLWWSDLVPKFIGSPQWRSLFEWFLCSMKRCWLE